MSEIMLAKGFSVPHLQFPVEVSVKLDGVAADFYKAGGVWLVQSRQGKPLPSTAHILRFFNTRCKHYPDGVHVVGELTVMGVPNFKDAGGIIRRKEEDRRIVLNIYDCYHPSKPNAFYEQRVQEIHKILKFPLQEACVSDGSLLWGIVTRVPVNAVCNDVRALQEVLNSVHEVMESSPMAEGFMVRNMRGKDSLYRVGKRSWGMQKFKPKPTADLFVHSFEEAIDKNGKPKGMVGGLKVYYKDDIIGVGPGRLTHKERTFLWKEWTKFNRDSEDHGWPKGIGPLAEIEYMTDDAYDALRQPTFQRWRTDKKEESYD